MCQDQGTYGTSALFFSAVTLPIYCAVLIVVRSSRGVTIDYLVIAFFLGASSTGKGEGL